MVPDLGDRVLLLLKASKKEHELGWIFCEGTVDRLSKKWARIVMENGLRFPDAWKGDNEVVIKPFYKVDFEKMMALLPVTFPDEDFCLSIRKATEHNTLYTSMSEHLSYQPVQNADKTPFYPGDRLCLLAYKSFDARDDPEESKTCPFPHFWTEIKEVTKADCYFSLEGKLCKVNVHSLRIWSFRQDPNNSFRVKQTSSCSQREDPRWRALSSPPPTASSSFLSPTTK